MFHYIYNISYKVEFILKQLYGLISLFIDC